ncbi:MAG: molybdopterin-converting factor chain 2 [Opitutae bacterium]|nr:molybdopterin-converting factor chain 2 [Opitutae bacterium]|tara:strand:- start:223 stop:660 length:438 start_codon:yes stop_codon:yes gene_type:complete
MFELTTQPIQEHELRSSMVNSECGGFVSFEGWVRDWNEGRRVNKLHYEAYESLALSEGQRIMDEALKQYPIRNLCSIHRLGELEVCDVAVWVGATGRHRAESFAACRFAIDQIKARVPIWKKEFYQDGESEWVGCPACANHGHSA